MDMSARERLIQNNEEDVKKINNKNNDDNKKLNKFIK